MKPKLVMPTGNRDRVINGKVLKVVKSESGTEVKISKTSNNRSGRRKNKRKA